MSYELQVREVLSIYFKTALHPVYTKQIYSGKLQNL